MRQRNFWAFMAMLLLGTAPPEPAVTQAIPGQVHWTAPGGEARVLSVMTYNVKGLPWPVAPGRGAALGEIGYRLAGMRAGGSQPQVVALQEAFSGEARAIGRIAGYAHIVDGPPPEAVQPARISEADRAFVDARRFSKGETQGKYVGSGLQILSDYPVLRVRRAPFPAFACAGYDCLANKGVLLVTLGVPGSPVPVEILTTHFNSRRSSGVPWARSLHAYRLQVEFLRGFLKRNHDPASPLIMAGDFNIGQRPDRSQALTANLSRWTRESAIAPVRDTLAAAMARTKGLSAPIADAHWIVNRASDRQFAVDGASQTVAATRLSVPFGHSAMLSDHMGFAVEYRFGS